MDSISSIRNKTIRKLRTRVLDHLNSDFAFTTFTEGDVDESMTQERAQDIIEMMPAGDYRLQVTFIKMVNDRWVIEKGRDTIKDSRRRNPFILNKDTAPGALVGIDSLYYDTGYPVSVVIYAAYKIREPDVRALQPMRHPGNCVGKLVREFFEDSSRGGKLTDKRREAIRKWEKDTHRIGGTIENIKKLETAIERRIFVKDITDGFIYPGTHKYGGRGAPIVIYQHNGHAWRELRFPKKKEVALYDRTPLYDLAKENSIWLMDEGGKQFITQDGILHRPAYEHEHILEACQELGEDFSEDVLSIRSLDFAAARKRNGWSPTTKYCDEISNSCVEHGHGGLWNMEYLKDEYVSLDMKHCYPASFRGLGDCKPYYKIFGHPDGQFFRVSLPGKLNVNVNGFIRLTTWELADDLHPIIYAWYGKHLHFKEWIPIPLLHFFLINEMITYTAHEALLCHSSFTEWLPTDNHASRIVIGKFTQGAKEGEKHMQRRLVTDSGELDFLIKKAHTDGTMVSVEEWDMLNGNTWNVLCYYQDHRPQYYHLRASMLAYAHINLLSMLLLFDKDDVPRVATDSLYIKPDVLKKVAGYYTDDEIAESGQWRIKNEEIKSWKERVQYSGNYSTGEVEPTTEYLPSILDPISYKRFSYLYGPGGSGKTTRVLKLFPKAKVLTPTHRLERELSEQGYDAQTYHSFFRWNGQKWVPEAIKDIPPVILWDEICTVPLEILKEFTDFLKGKTQIIFAGDPAQPPPIAGESPHKWLKELCYYEKITDDYRSKDHVRKLKEELRGLSDQDQCAIMRKRMRAKKYEDFLKEWHPKDLVLSSKRASQARIQKDLLKEHKNRYPKHRVPVIYKPRDSRAQNKNIEVPKAGIILANAVTYDKAWVFLEDVEDIISHPDWRLGYCITIHSAQGLTIKENLWLIDQRLCWSNLIYTAISRVEYAKQLKRAWGPQLRYDKTSEDVAKENIMKKLLRYKKQDAEKGVTFDLCVDDIYEKNARCAKCNIPLLWKFEANDDQQFSVDRLDNRKGHCRGNIRLTCLECNRSRGASLL